MSLKNSLLILAKPQFCPSRNHRLLARSLFDPILSPISDPILPHFSFLKFDLALDAGFPMSSTSILSTDTDLDRSR